MKKVGNTGAVEFRGIRLGIGRVLAGRRVRVMDAGRSVTISDLRSALIIEHFWPKPGINDVSNGRPPGPDPRSTIHDCWRQFGNTRGIAT